MIAHFTLEEELLTAVAQERLNVHYQPKFHLASGELQGVEALVRWRDSSGRWVSPSVFVPLLESMGLIERVGCWIFERAASDCEYWQVHGRCARRVAVNVSPLQLSRKESLSALLAICGEWPARDTALDIELTESAVLPDSPALIRAIDELSARNVIIALDDFGTGYSSLSLLNRLPVQHLKIDRSFVAQLTTNRRAVMIVEAVIKLAHALGMESIAEGVESKDQIEQLKDLGCDIVQGFFFSPAVSRDKLLRFLSPGVAGQSSERTPSLAGP